MINLTAGLILLHSENELALKGYELTSPQRTHDDIRRHAADDVGQQNAWTGYLMASAEP